jgi:hypothetical protein
MAPRRIARLYRSAKISEGRFRKVLEHFARDASATDAARATGLSINTTHAIYRKLRVFFYEVGLFLDFYEGKDPVAFESGDPHGEFALLEFHFARIRAKRGLKSPADEPPYHLAESWWRYQFKMLMNERPSAAVHAMMVANLLELIRICGPVGAPPRNLEAGALAIVRQIDQRIAWLRRNAPGFADIETRKTLMQIEAIATDNS